MAKDGRAIGAIRDKLVAIKQGWVREGRLLTGRHGTPEADRLPPGQRLVATGRCSISACSPRSRARGSA